MLTSAHSAHKNLYGKNANKREQIYHVFIHSFRRWSESVQEVLFNINKYFGLTGEHKTGKRNNNTHWK